jgi:hypothetical protein
MAGATGKLYGVSRPLADNGRVRRIARRLKSRVAAVPAAPLTPKAVDRALGVTPRERIRWYKDGRLPTCGRTSVSGDMRSAHFPLFPFDEIARRQANPQAIEARRREDAGADRASATGSADAHAKPSP